MPPLSNASAARERALDAPRMRWRDRLLSNPRFQRWAADFPLVRRIARRRAGELFDLCAGFVYSQILLACVRLKVFEALRQGPLSARDLAARISLPVESTARLAEAAISLRLLERRGADLVGLGAHGAALLGNPAVLAMIEHHALLYADLRDPIALLREPQQDTELRRYWAYAKVKRPGDLGADEVAAYTELMSRSQPLVAEDILDAYPLGVHRCLLDVGGGDGSFLLAAARHAPRLRCVLFDLPAVAARARIRFEDAGLGHRAQAEGGDFLTQPLPRGADLISLVRVVHDHDDAAVLTLLAAVREALPPGGRVLIGEPLAETPGANRMGAAYFGFYLLAMGSGRPRTAEELSGLLRRAGFVRPTVLATRHPLQTGVIVATRA